MRKSHLQLHTEPVAKARARVTRRGFAYTPKKSKDSEKAIIYLIRQQFNESVYDVAIKVIIHFGIKKPKSVKRIHPSCRPDVDNFAKQIIDSGNKLLWEDDSLICDLRVIKKYSEEPFIEVFIEELVD